MRKWGKAVAVMVSIIAALAATQVHISAADNKDIFVLHEGDPSVTAVWRSRSDLRKEFGKGAAGFNALWREICKLNPEPGPCTSYVYSHLPVGTQLRLPHPKASTEIARVEAPVTPEVKRELENKSVTQAGMISVSNSHSFPGLLESSFIAAAAVTVLFLMTGSAKRKSLKKSVPVQNSSPALFKEMEEKIWRQKAAVLLKENEELRKHLAEKEELINEHFYFLATPKGMESVDGKLERAYLRISPMDGKPSVVTKDRVPVMIHNLVRHLDRLSPDKLLAEGYKKISQPVAEQKVA